MMLLKKDDWGLLLSLYVSFVKIGGFTLGGGYAMIPIIQREAVDVKKWVTDEEMADFIVIGQSLPGVVGINTATTVGNRAAGIKGAVAATLGMITPSLVIIILVAMFFDDLMKSEVVLRAFMGIRAAVAALIIAAVVRLVKTSVKSIFQGVAAIAACLGILAFDISPPYMLLLAAVAAIIYKTIIKCKEDDKERKKTDDSP